MKDIVATCKASIPVESIYKKGSERLTVRKLYHLGLVYCFLDQHACFLCFQYGCSSVYYFNCEEMLEMRGNAMTKIDTKSFLIPSSSFCNRFWCFLHNTISSRDLFVEMVESTCTMCSMDLRLDLNFKAETVMKFIL